MEIVIYYDVYLGRDDGVDGVEYDTIELNDEQTKAAIEFALTDETDRIFELEEFEGIYEDLRRKIIGEEICNLVEAGDENIMESQGYLPMDEDELNDLVHSKDQHALEYFGLENSTDEEIAKWNANDLYDIPTVEEFEPDFEPSSPFDDYNLRVYVGDAIITEEELRNYLKPLFDSNSLESIEEIRDWCTVKFDRNIEDIIMDVAKEMNCTEYIESCAKEE